MPIVNGGMLRNDVAVSAVRRVHRKDGADDEENAGERHEGGPGETQVPGTCGKSGRRRNGDTHS